MPLPQHVYKPGFDITRISHVALQVKDLAASRAFYVDTLGFVVTDETKDTVWLRGLEEACHHSLVLKKSGEAVCDTIGFRVLTEEDLDLAADHFANAGLPTDWVEVPGQKRTLRTQDVSGVPLEFCASMEVQERMIMQVDRFHSACPHRIDHAQLHVPQVQRACDFYAAMGFRISEYIVPNDASDTLAMVFMQRKGNPHDIVFATGPGPRLHHMAFTVPEVSHLMLVSDVCAQHGFGKKVEFGPGRHFGPGLARFVYLRDPDGHRIELFPNHYQTMDIEDEPVRWTFDMLNGSDGWGPPPPQSWFDEAMPFAGREVVAPDEADKRDSWAEDVSKARETASA